MYPFKEIREYYAMLTPLIMEVSGKNPKRWITPYSGGFDWPDILSPIELPTWMAIRSFGKAPMYPQYPVGRYFVDFGNPALKVAIECDGKEWHQHRAEQDRIRDTELAALGWDVYRICGSDCVNIIEEYSRIFSEGCEPYTDIPECVHSFYAKTIEGLIKAIGFFYFGYNTVIHDREYDLVERCVRDRISIDTGSLDVLYEKFQRRRYKN